MKGRYRDSHTKNHARNGKEDIMYTWERGGTHYEQIVKEGTQINLDQGQSQKIRVQKEGT
jgi:hypothetical protein